MGNILITPGTGPQQLVPGDGITFDTTDERSPVISAGGGIVSITNLGKFDVVDTTDDIQPLTGLITIPANFLAAGSQFFSQFVAEHLVSVASPGYTGALYLSLDGDMVNWLSFQTLTILTTPNRLNNAGIGGVLTNDVAPDPNCYVMSCALGDIDSGGSMGFSGNARWSNQEFAFGGFGIGQGGFVKFVLDTTIAHTLQWFWSWLPHHNTALTLRGFCHKVFIIK